MSYSFDKTGHDKPEVLIAPINIDNFIEFIVAAHRETFRITFGSDITDEFLDKELARTRTDSTNDENSVIGVFAANELVGHAVLETRFIASDGLHGWIHFYYVAPQFRRHGIGARLVRYSVEYFTTLGLTEFYLSTGENNRAAQEFYLRMGFFRVPEGDKTGSSGVGELMMGKKFNSRVED